MKAFLANKLVLAVVAGMVVVGAGVGVYFGVINKDNEIVDADTAQKTVDTNSNNDFQRTGQNSFGLAVCDEMTKAEVGDIIGKPIVKTEDYSLSGNSGCEYFVENTTFVIIDVEYSDMATHKKSLEFFDRVIKTDDRIKLENMLSYSEEGLNDVYMNIAPGQKYVRVGRSSISVVSEEQLIQLAIATEAKIRSYK